MHRKFRIGALVVVALIPMLIAASGGFPSRPRFLSFGVNTPAPATAGTAKILTGLSVGSAAAPTGTGNLTIGSIASPSFVGSGALFKVAGAGSSGFAIRANSLASEAFLNVGSNTEFGTNTNTTLSFYTNNVSRCTLSTAGVLDCAAGFTVGGAAIPSTTSGTFTATLSSGCTTTPSVTADYSVVGGVVTLMVPAFSDCTSNGTGLVINGVPVAIRTTAGGGPTIIRLTCSAEGVSRATVDASGNIVLQPIVINCNTGTISFSRFTSTYKTTW